MAVKGKPNHTVGQWWQAVEQVFHRFGISPRLLRFLVVGGSGVFVNLGVLYLLVVLLPDSPLRPHIASLSGIAVSIFTNFVLNDIWTWGDRPKEGVLHWFERLLKFYLVSSAAALIQYGVFFLLFELVGFETLLGERWGSLVAQCIGILCALVINFVVNNYWTFRDKPKTPDPAPTEGAHSEGESDPTVKEDTTNAV